MDEGLIKKVPNILENIRSTNKNLRYQATQEIRKILSVEVAPPIDQLIDLGFVPILHEYLLDSTDPMTQYESSWALTNIASGNPEHTSLIVEYEIHKSFLDLLSCDISIELTEQNIWAIGNIVGDSSHNRDIVLKEGVIDRIKEILAKHKKISLVSNISWTISNLCRGNPRPEFEEVKPLLPIIKNLLVNYKKNDEILSDTLWACSFLTENSTNETEAFNSIIDEGLVPIIIKIVSAHNKVSVLTPGFRILGNLLTGSDTVTQELIDCGVLTVFPKFLNHSRQSFVKEAFWSLSNITSGNIKQIQSTIDTELLKIALVIGIKNIHQSVDVSREILWAIINAISGGSLSQIRYLVTNRCTLLFFKLFNVATSMENLFSYYIDAIIILLKDALLTVQTGEYAFYTKYYSGSFILDGTILNQDFSGYEDLYDKVLKAIGEVKQYISKNNLELTFSSLEIIEEMVKDTDEFDDFDSSDSYEEEDNEFYEEDDDEEEDDDDEEDDDEEDDGDDEEEDEEEDDDEEEEEDEDEDSGDH